MGVNESQKGLTKSQYQRKRSKRRTQAYQKDLEEAVKDTHAANKIQALKFKQKWQMSDDEGTQYPILVDNIEFSENGVGLQLFFDFIKYAAITFLVMAIIGSVPMYVNYTGDGLQGAFGSESMAYNKFTIANQPQLQVLVATEDASEEIIQNLQDQNNQAVNDFVEDMAVRENYIVVPDIMYTFVFLIFIIFWHWKSKRIRLIAEDLNATPSIYTIYIKNINSDTSEFELKERFQEIFGKIAEIKFVKNYNGTLFAFKSIAELREKLEIEETRIQLKPNRGLKEKKKIIQQLKKEEQELNQLIKKKLGKNKKHNDYDSIGAYIVFSEESSKKNCARVFKDNSGICGDKDDIIYLRGKQMKYQQEVDEPSNLKWENLDASKVDIYKRKCIVIILIIIVMFLTFTVIFIANLIKPTNSNNCPTSEITYEEAQLNKDDDYQVECYCRQLSPQEIVSDKEQKAFCWDTYLKFAYLLAISIGSALVIALVNFLLKSLLRSLAKYQKYPTITAETEGITMSLFFAMFVNTAILTLLFQADIYGWQPAVTISSPIPPLANKQESQAQQFSADFDRSWYSEVGGKITYTMGFYVLFPHFFYFLALPLIRYFRQKKVKSAIIQRDMNKYIMGPEFQVTQYYAIVLNIIFTTLFYSSGIPLLLWLAAVGLGIQYWVYKYMLLRYNKRPPSYDYKLNKQILDILPWAIVLHLMVGIYMYGSPLIFPESSNSVKKTVDSTFSTTNGSTDFLFSSTTDGTDITYRTRRQVYMFSLLVLVSFIWIFKILLWGWIKWVYYKCKGEKEENNEIYEFKPYEVEYSNISQNMLASYDIRVNSNYAKLVQSMDGFETKESNITQQKFQNNHSQDQSNIQML